VSTSARVPSSWPLPPQRSPDARVERIKCVPQTRDLAATYFAMLHYVRLLSKVRSQPSLMANLTRLQDGHRLSRRQAAQWYPTTDIGECSFGRTARGGLRAARRVPAPDRPFACDCGARTSMSWSCELVKGGQERGQVKRGDAAILADMLGGALCTVATAAMRRRRKHEEIDLELIASSCWALIAA